MDAMLSYVVAKIDGTKVSVKDILKFERNVLGGAHAGVAKTKTERTIERLYANLGFYGDVGLRAVLAGVGDVVLQGIADRIAIVRSEIGLPPLVSTDDRSLKLDRKTRLMVLNGVMSSVTPPHPNPRSLTSNGMMRF